MLNEPHIRVLSVLFPLREMGAYRDQQASRSFHRLKSPRVASDRNGSAYYESGVRSSISSGAPVKQLKLILFMPLAVPSDLPSV